jgi:hypothetical protein
VREHSPGTDPNRQRVTAAAKSNYKSFTPDGFYPQGLYVRKALLEKEVFNGHKSKSQANKNSGVTMNVQSKILLRSVIRQLVVALEMLNKIDEKDFAEIVKKARTNKPQIKGVLDNAGRGNIFMMIFFIRELIEFVIIE